jgi:hypothetical protein
MTKIYFAFRFHVFNMILNLWKIKDLITEGSKEIQKLSFPIGIINDNLSVDE